MAAGGPTHGGETPAVGGEARQMPPSAPVGQWGLWVARAEERPVGRAVEGDAQTDQPRNTGVAESLTDPGPGCCGRLRGRGRVHQGGGVLPAAGGARDRGGSSNIFIISLSIGFTAPLLWAAPDHPRWIH